MGAPWLKEVWMDKKRNCGACVACCTVAAVAELDKPERTRCKHQYRHGCKIYKTRPDACRSYSCGWLKGLGDARDRPDKLGVIFAAYGGRGSGSDQRKTLQVSEVRGGASDDPRVGAIIELALDGDVVDQVCIIRADGTRQLRFMDPHNG